MTRIGQGTKQIQEFHQAKRAENDARVDAQKEKTEAAKQESLDNTGSAFAEINKNNSETLTGAIGEGLADTAKAMGALGEAGAAVIADAVSDAVVAAEDAIYDTGSVIAEGAHVVASGAADVGTYIAGGLKSLFSAFTQGGNEALDKKYEDV